MYCTNQSTPKLLQLPTPDSRYLGQACFIGRGSPRDGLEQPVRTQEPGGKFEFRCQLNPEVLQALQPFLVKWVRAMPRRSGSSGEVCLRKSLGFPDRGEKLWSIPGYQLPAHSPNPAQSGEIPRGCSGHRQQRLVADDSESGAVERFRHASPPDIQLTEDRQRPW